MTDLSAQKAAVDAAFTTLSGAVSTYLAAGGAAETVGRGLIAHTAGIDPAISRVCDVHGNLAINDRPLRAVAFADAHER
ncbi:hypothetical protein [Mesorhizobium huakuii]|uniref:Uncharacterized protein n=1 Tax=Mesorhizobium huakuii TaxID=28104 RepID=A0A7G6STN8_9HYPH|nr:hypothetical protein [Mesorhizobium huakuii]QND57870.1 hypothetical protein HB778_15630 [Mesorhizobium huakuii]